MKRNTPMHLIATCLAYVLAPCSSGQSSGVTAVAAHELETVGVVDNLPVFYRQAAARVNFPMSWLSESFSDYQAWRKLAHDKVLSCLLMPPPAAPWNPVVVAEEHRGTHTARKLVLNVTGFSRVLAYMTVPKGKGLFPAVLLLHDH